MVRIGTVWDRTIDVLAGRAGILAGLAALYLFLPDVVSAAISSFGGAGFGVAMLGLAVSIAVIVLMILGILAMTAVASDPAVGRTAAVRVATRRLGAAIGVVLVMAAVATLAFVPLGVMMYLAGISVDAVSGRADLTRADMNMVGLAGLLAFVVLLGGLWLSARFAPLLAVVVNERRGFGAFRRAFVLTRGAGARLVGVVVLYAIVLLVLMGAVTSVTGIVARLLLGAQADASVAFVVGVATAVVTAAATVVQTVFYTQFYVAARGSEGASPPHAA
jgi:hypothetical protein